MGDVEFTEYLGFRTLGMQDGAFVIELELALTAAKNAASEDYEAAIADLDRHNYLLRVSEKRYAKPSISNEDREHERQDADFRRREIARIEGRLPQMLDEIEKTQVALEAFRIELLSMGLEI